MSAELIFGIILSLIGAYVIYDAAKSGAINSRRGRLIVSLFGANGARVFYIILGALVTFLGIYYIIAGI